MEAQTRLICLTLRREVFVEILGPLEQLMTREKSPQVITQRLLKLQTKGTPTHMPAEVQAPPPLPPLAPPRLQAPGLGVLVFGLSFLESGTIMAICNLTCVCVCVGHHLSPITALSMCQPGVLQCLPKYLHMPSSCSIWSLEEPKVCGQQASWLKLVLLQQQSLLPFKTASSKVMCNKHVQQARTEAAGKCKQQACHCLKPCAAWSVCMLEPPDIGIPQA